MSEPEQTPQQNPVARREEEILAFWQKENIFEKSVERPAGLAVPRGEFVFYDGPPFATGQPHFGHVIPTSIKDAIPRYKTMQGYRVRRRWGWDCHGLPVENIIEKELGLKSKKDILDYGIEKFNFAARQAVLRYANDWRKIIPRLGRWVDMDNDYKTMSASYTESVWWVFKSLQEKGLIYEGFKAMQLCPRCETTLSNFEVNQGYRDVTDISVYVKFELVDEPGIFLVAWTTTPWTLPGNVALAVGPTISYVKVTVPADVEKTEKVATTPAKPYTIIVAEERLPALATLLKKELKIIGQVKASELIGKSYKPVFDYYSSEKDKPGASKGLAGIENGWKIYAADFVTTTDGTGIVHIAPAFGADDLELGKKYDLPFIQHVAVNGTFKKEVTDFAGQYAKPKEAPQQGDIEIIKYLANNPRGSLLLAKEKITHSYAHCWRCETPLLNYATSSWFVKVTDIVNDLVAENKKVNWVPEEVGQGRFGNWLLGARDWAISRSRFWGAPLPVWKTEDGKELVFIGSIDELKKYSSAKNTYYIVRHGESENNTQNIISSVATNPHHLTEKGRVQATEAAKWFVDKKIDLVFVSPFVRTRETAEIISKTLKLKPEQVIVAQEIHELDAGKYDGVDFYEFTSKFPLEKRFEITPEGGESYADIKKRMGDFLYGLEKKYAGKNILIVTHDSPAFLLSAAVRGLTAQETIVARGTSDHFIKNATPMRLDFVPLPHNEAYELDLHRPFIDDIELNLSGKKLVRVPEVFDCWFESGSMPYGEVHYPFENTDEFEPKQNLFKKIFGTFTGADSNGYPADFIAEGQDQTRGWFYSMLVLGVALFGRTPYKNVIANGLVLAEDGQKMSKSKQNYPDLMLTINKYGSDALRYYLLSSPLVRAQEFCFSERGVDEVLKKHIGRLNNVVSFYEMYAGEILSSTSTSSNVLDQWIVARLAELGREVTRAMEAYELDRAARPFADFIDDLSTWYIRRSRDRFKDGNREALATTQYVLETFAKLIAPFMPFLAEDVYQRVKGKAAAKTSAQKSENKSESVHLCAWPIFKDEGKSKEKNVGVLIIAQMTQVRAIASLGLEARSKAKINVRQPLAKLIVTGVELSPAFVELITDEVNVKKVEWKVVAGTELSVEIDTTLNPALVEEGEYRELVRKVQDLRKQTGLTVSDLVVLQITAGPVARTMIKKYQEELMKTTGLKDVVIVEAAGEEKLALKFV